MANSEALNTVNFIGVDVGTGSVRAALINGHGKILKVCSKETQTWTPQTGYFEQSTDDIWAAACETVKDVIKDVPATSIKGIGFDATCSLVALDVHGKPLTISPTGDSSHNVVLWLDHRASQEADFINSLDHSVLKYVGGKISLEMETPKLLWLKKNLKKECWDKSGYFFDLPDFLTWRATGSDSRSLCSLVCKWTYVANPEGVSGWNEDYFRKIGLDDLIPNNWKKIGSVVKDPGTPCGKGLSSEAARELGLLPGTAVGTSIIDAHAGGLGMIGCSVDGVSEEFHTRLGLICGTSTCHMAISKNPLFVPGIWGPYYSAMVPGYWLNEGGQSATGKLIDHIITTHPAYRDMLEKAGSMHIQEYLMKYLQDLAKSKNLDSIDHLSKEVHVWPDFHGNRSPIADPTLRGMISGLLLSSDEENLAILYLATVQALAYGTRHILEELKEGGHTFNCIILCGGLSRSPLFTQTQADVVGLPVICPHEVESVLLGAGILGACAAGVFSNVNEAIKTMGGKGDIVRPRREQQRYHDKKYRVFLKMVEHQYFYKAIMSGS